MAVPSFISHIYWIFHFFIIARLIRCLAWLGVKNMAVTSSSSASTADVASSSSVCSIKHEVFLSFRGEDTRAKFTSHLHKKLCGDKKIETYIDNRLEKGDSISDALIEAIRGSKISVIIFSDNYATSSWCLDEVLCILECMKKRKQVVIPVFYEVDPSHVRKQSGSYEAAFAKLRVRFEDERVDQWRAALTEVANLSGWHSQQYGTDSVFVEEIVNDIVRKLNGMSATGVFEDYVGINKSIVEMETLLCIDSSDIRIIGIWGMGGLGKTTLARVLSERLSSNFEGCCFLENVREESEKQGLDKLKKKLFSDLLEENDQISITTFHKNRLRCKRVLIVLDDVNQPEQLDDLAGDHSWFGDGSRVIVTTRDDEVLRNRADEKYELKGLNFECALKLFILNAFKKNYSLSTDDIEKSKQVVTYAGGIPLVIKVIARLLRSKRRDNWEYELNKLKETPHKKVQNALELSYYGLDKQEQRVFLDIACFVDVGKRTCRHYVECRLGGDRSLKRDIDSLIDKSLIFDEHNYLRMHDLVREMGLEIVRQESEEPGKRSRLWTYEDCNHVLKNNSGTKTIEGISLTGRSNFNIRTKTELNPAVFKEMQNLRFLRIQDPVVKPPQGLEYLPHSLKYLQWDYWPFKYMPTVFFPDNVAELKICYSNLEQLWSGDQKLGNLKHVDLHSSEMLSDVSALSQAPNLETVDLSFCESLCQLPSLRFGENDKSYHKCDENSCSFLGYLNLSWCCNLKALPSISGCVKTLNLFNCKMLENLPASVFELKSLKSLLLRNCSISEIPNEIRYLSFLEVLDLSGNPICEIPTEIQQLCKLKKLYISYCKILRFLPELPLSLQLVDASESNVLHSASISRDVLQQKPWSDYFVTRPRILILYFKCSSDQKSHSRIIEEFQLRVWRMEATIVLNNVKVNEELSHLDVGTCFPGNEIPKWFTYHSETSTINVKLPTQWHNANFLGFALCVVVAQDIYTARFLDLSCVFDFKTNSTEKSRGFKWYFSEKDEHCDLGQTKGYNMFMLYKYENCRDYHDAVEVSVHFSFGFRLSSFKVTACGIRLLYLQDYEERFGTSIVVGDKPEPSGSGPVDSDTN